MSHPAMPVPQIAHLLGIPPQDLHTLLRESGATSQGDPTLVALTVEEAARRISVGRTTMYTLIASGAVRSVQVGRLRRIPARALDEYIAAQAQAATTAPAA